MASIPASELAQEVLDACLKDGSWPSRSLDALVERALDEDDPFQARAATRALFGILIEKLGDLFEPALCDVYARLFAQIISRALPEYDAAELFRRYRLIRQVRRFPGGEVRKVFVLSRVTLGADVAVSSVMLAGAKHRFPDSEIFLVGPEKNAELFAADERIRSNPLPYGRASLLRERLQTAAELLAAVAEPSAIVIDPDSRLTQLGLIPVLEDDAHYYFFESRAFGGSTNVSLPRLAAAWFAEVFDTEHFKPYVAPKEQAKIADIAVSWGAGENGQKRMSDEFEAEILGQLLRTGRNVLLDRGEGGDEGRRASHLAIQLGTPDNLKIHEGSYASFASHVVQSSLYVGYDSAGQHVAAAAGVPLVSIFKGHTGERMLSRWAPDTEHSLVIAVGEDEDPSSVVDRTRAAIEAAVAEESGASRD